MSELVRIDDHTERMLAQLPSFMRDKPRIEAFIRAIGVQVQKVEQFLWDLFYYAMIDNAEDAMLDQIGDLVREPRQGRVDDEYRRYIRARIRVYKSDGQVEQLIQILRLILGLDEASTAEIEVRELHPAAMEITVVNAIADTADGEYINRGFLQKAKAAGVRLHFIVSHQPRASTLIFDWTSGTVTTTAQRPGSSTGTTGGLTSAMYGA